MEKKEESAASHRGLLVIKAQTAVLATEEVLLAGAWLKNWVIQPESWYCRMKLHSWQTFLRQRWFLSAETPQSLLKRALTDSILWSFIRSA